MRVLYVISTFQDTGGHYFSMLTTAECYRRAGNEVYVVNVGVKVSSTIANGHLPYEFVFFNGVNFLSAGNTICRIARSFNADIIHAFDYLAYTVAFFSAKKKHLPILLTKCGGPSPYRSLKFPIPSDLVLFHMQDMEYFSKEKRFSNVVLHLIPNRVSEFQVDEERVGELKDKYCLDNKRVIMRIGRVSDSYLKTIRQSISLAKALHELDDSFVLLCIGIVQSEEKLANMQNLAEGRDFIFFETSQRYTRDAKGLLGLAEIVIGTGRNFMEACCLNKKLFVPCVNHNLPTYVSESNFQQVFYYNFSERFVDLEEEMSPCDILKRLQSDHNSSRSWFERYFSSDILPLKYGAVYQRMRDNQVIPGYSSIFFSAFFIFLYSIRVNVFHR